jgi:hypothetical protein
LNKLIKVFWVLPFLQKRRLFRSFFEKSRTSGPRLAVAGKWAYGAEN